MRRLLLLAALPLALLLAGCGDAEPRPEGGCRTVLRTMVPVFAGKSTAFIPVYATECDPTPTPEVDE